ncbi:hypothetical protein ATK17_0134 [Branchiibius hedensis]|uniref:VOC domain-containing protein n=1 Tax=Branchiibius hedensis TaxID=672460 RepID=A0A2Y8ZRC8_9MICO|nr:VOC family protein [Branchiibius hedensis]PWJ24051.1 hypothetical protein ATK17_0134 [Branchiibius hedensis]SSA32869.1 hypothetical protein SAMN04489750_0134 [Branchiibius hedensis]
MSLRVAMITLDSADPLPIARWWSDQFGGRILAENEGWFVVVEIAETQPRLAFQRVADPTPGKNRMHLDLHSEDPGAEVSRLTTAGATLVADHEIGGTAWTTLADPDGNQFCVAGAPAGG